MKEPIILPKNQKPRGVAKGDVGLMNRDGVLSTVDWDGDELPVSPTSANVSAAVAGFTAPQAAAARTGMGLGSAATTAATDYATAAQGVTADAAVPRTSTALVYAKEYGMAANGVINDTEALQTAITVAQALTTATSRATVVLPRGVIRLGRSAFYSAPETHKEAIELFSNINIVGQGIGATVLKLLDGVSENCPTMIANAQARTNCATTNSSTTVTVTTTTGLFVGMTLTGTGITGGAVVTSITNSTQLVISIAATATNAVVTLTFDAANIMVSNLTIDGNAITRACTGGSEDEGLNFKQGANIVVSHVEIKNCGQDGIDFDAGQDILITGCIFHNNFGNGIHAVGGGPTRMRIIGCSFIGNGFVRRAIDGVSGGGIDSIATYLVVHGCTFKDNAKEIECYGGDMTVTGCTFSHSLPTGVTNYPAIEASSSAAGASLTIDGCFIFAGIGNGITVSNSHEFLFVRNSNIMCSVLDPIGVTSGKKVVVQNNRLKGRYCVLLTLTTLAAEIQGNLFESSTQPLRIEASANGLCSGNLFADSGGVSLIQLRSGATGWRILNNQFPAAGTGISNVSGGGANSVIMGNTGTVTGGVNTGFDLSLGSAGSIIKGNQLDVVTMQDGSAINNIIEGNTITGTISHTTATFASNTWRRNTGAGCSGIFYGTANLVSGTATVTTAAANSARKWSLTRQAKNSSTGIGALSVGTITAQTSFVIDALSVLAAVDTGDLSSVYWEILE